MEELRYLMNPQCIILNQNVGADALYRYGFYHAMERWRKADGSNLQALVYVAG